MRVIVEGTLCGCCGWRMWYRAPMLESPLDQRWIECANQQCAQFQQRYCLPTAEVGEYPAHA